MMSRQITHGDITKSIERFAPVYLKEDYDNVGFIVGDSKQHCTGVMVGFDCSLALAKQAKEKKCNLIVTHHPLIFKGLKKIPSYGFPNDVIHFLIKNDIAHYAVHTNIDNVIFGVSKKIVDDLQLQNAHPLLPKSSTLGKLVYYAPPAHVEKINQALFDAGAGEIGQYSSCHFSSEGVATFLPLEGANPFLGKKNKLSLEKETKVEMVFPIGLQSNIIQTLLTHHPYEEVAYDIYALKNEVDQWGGGVVGHLKQELTEKKILERLAEKWSIQYFRHTPLNGRKIKCVAFCGGSGASFIPQALSAGADIFITGDLKYHDFVDHLHSPMLLVDIGHWESERHIVQFLYQFIRAEFPKFAVQKEKNLISPICFFSSNNKKI